MSSPAATAETPDKVSHLLRHKTAGAHDHPVNVVHHDQATAGERIADAVAAGIGSWPFLIIQTVIVVLWVVLNITGFLLKWDEYPFILLNLMFSVQAAYSGPIILLAGNRQSQKDRLTLEHAAAEADLTEARTLKILEEIEKNTSITVKILEHLQSQQQEVLDSARRVEAAHRKQG